MSRPNAAPSSTLFLPELPSMLTDGELEPHFRNFPGFAGSRTRKDRNGKLVGFVEFEDVDSAIRCRESQQGASPFPGISWHIHFSNNTQGRPPAAAGSAGKRPREETGPPVPRQDAQRQSFGCARGTYPAPVVWPGALPASFPAPPPLHHSQLSRTRTACSFGTRCGSCSIS